MLELLTAEGPEGAPRKTNGVGPCLCHRCRHAVMLAKGYSKGAQDCPVAGDGEEIGMSSGVVPGRCPGVSRVENILPELSHEIIACAMRVHSSLGRGLLESIYEECL